MDGRRPEPLQRLRRWSANGPDGSTNTATTLSFADTTSTVLYAVHGTSYAGQQLTFSIWAMSATPTTLNLTLTDSPYTAATSSAPCSVTSTWQRCSLTYTFPAGAGTGFAAVLTASTYATPINVWGAQVEVAAQPGPYVSTIGVARPSVSGGAGTVTYSDTTGFADGSHSITVQYGGDANFVASTSNVVALTVGKATANLTLTPSPSSGAVYGGTITLTALLSNQDSGSPLYPSGTVTFYNNGTQIGTGTLAEVGGGNTSTYLLTLSGASSLPAGSDSLTVSYSGDSNFNAANDTSTPITYSVAKASFKQCRHHHRHQLAQSVRLRRFCDVDHQRIVVRRRPTHRLGHDCGHDHHHHTRNTRARWFRQRNDHHSSVRRFVVQRGNARHHCHLFR